MASKRTLAQQNLIKYIYNGGLVYKQYHGSSFHGANGMVASSLVSQKLVEFQDKPNFRQLILTPAGQQEYERLFPAAAPASQPQTVTPADEAALGVSMSELDAALDAVPQDTVDSMLAFIASRPRSADVFQPSGLAILDGLVAEGKATLTNGYYEATKALPADRQPVTSEPDMRDHRLASMYTDYCADAYLNGNTSVKDYATFLEDKINNMDIAQGIEYLTETLLIMKCIRLARTDGADAAQKALEDVRQYEPKAPGIYERVRLGIIETLMSEGKCE